MAAGGAVAVRGFAGSGEPTRAELRAAPVHWPRPSVLEVGLEALDGVGPKLAEAARAAGIATVGDLLYRFPHSHRDRQIRLLEALEPGETGHRPGDRDGQPAAPVPQRQIDDGRRESRRRDRQRAGDLVQPALGLLASWKKAPRC